MPVIVGPEEYLKGKEHAEPRHLMCPPADVDPCVIVVRIWWSFTGTCDPHTVGMGPWDYLKASVP